MRKIIAKIFEIFCVSFKPAQSGRDNAFSFCTDFADMIILPLEKEYEKTHFSIDLHF